MPYNSRMRIVISLSGAGIPPEASEEHMERLRDEVRAHYPEAKVQIGKDPNITIWPQKVAVEDVEDELASEIAGQVHWICEQVRESRILYKN